MFELKTFKESIAKILNIKTAQEQLGAAVAQIEALTTENETLKNSLKAAVTDTVTQTAHTAALETLRGEYEKKISDLQTELQAAKTSSEANTRKALNEIGVPADQLPTVTTKQDTTLNVLEEASKLQGYELAKYLTTNKKAVSEALKKQSKR